ncbi:MAG: hypothetical protein WCA10_05325 [Terracidiphilus sp.]
MKKVIALGVLAVVIALVGLRIYGAFETEHNEAVDRAKKADTESAQLLEEYNRINNQSLCNLQWLQYRNHQLDNQIAELKGGRQTYFPEPLCSGYPDTDPNHSLQEMMDSLNAMTAQLNAREYAVYEWKYADNRRIQGKYLAAKTWASLKGTKLPDLYQAHLEQDWEKAEDAKAAVKPVRK